MHTTPTIRNVALVGHGGTGKTSLAEAMLLHAGEIGRAGRVEEGTTVCDFDPQERNRHHSIALSVASFDWNGHRINLIDTPGHPEFQGDAHGGLAAADLAVFVIDGVAGVQAQDEVLWRAAAARKLPRVVFVNKLDRDRASFDRTLAHVRQRFGGSIEPVELPIGEHSGFHGVADLLTERAYVYDDGVVTETEVPAELVDREHSEHDHLVEDVVETDDDLLERYLSGEVPDDAELEAALHASVDEAVLFPVLVGSATEDVAVDRLLEFICHVGPAPGEPGPVPATGGDTDVEIPVDPAGPAVVHVFATRIDPYLGQLSLFKVVSGTVRTDDVLVNTRTRSDERMHQMFALVGARHDPVAQVGAGDIAAVAKLNGTATGDTLAVAGQPVSVRPAHVPAPVYGIAIRSASPALEDRLAVALNRLQLEDPSLSVTRDADTGQLVLRGGGETHLQVALARLADGGLEIVADEVQVPYRETLAGPATTTGSHKKQTGGHGQYGVATVRFEPLPGGSGFVFEDNVVGGAIPRSLIPAVEQGIAQAMSTGGRYGYPVVDVKAVCIDGKTHSVDSSELAFKMAGSLAFRAALDEVGVVALEPVSEVTVVVPADLQGEVLGDLSARRGRVLGSSVGDHADEVEIVAHVPTAEMMRYAIDLRSLTGGRGRFRMEHHDYQQMSSPPPPRD